MSDSIAQLADTVATEMFSAILRAHPTFRQILMARVLDLAAKELKQWYWDDGALSAAIQKRTRELIETEFAPIIEGIAKRRAAREARKRAKQSGLTDEEINQLHPDLIKWLDKQGDRGNV